MRKYPSIPHPLVLEPPFGFPPGQEAHTAEIGAVLVGHGIEHASAVADAIALMGSRGVGKSRLKFTVADVRFVLPRRASARSWFTWADLLAETEKADPAEVSVRLLTPTRLVADGRLVSPTRFRFVHLARAALSRASLLARFHAGVELNVDFRGLLQAMSAVKADVSLRFTDLARYSARQGREIPLGGLTGTVRAQGELLGILPFLSLMSVVHVGKGTIFGLGKIAVEGR